MARNRHVRALPVGAPNPVDVHVGSRLRLRRTVIGLSQEGIGDMIGLTFQQIQKYERGANRIGAARLYMFAVILDVPVSYFFEEMAPGIQRQEDQLAIARAGRQADFVGRDPMARRETLELVRFFHGIPSGERNRIIALAQALADAPQAMAAE